MEPTPLTCWRTAPYLPAIYDNRVAGGQSALGIRRTSNIPIVSRIAGKSLGQFWGSQLVTLRDIKVTSRDIKCLLRLGTGLAYR